MRDGPGRCREQEKSEADEKRWSLRTSDNPFSHCDTFHFEAKSMAAPAQKRK